MDELGYDIEWQLFNSKDWGVPHNRERVYTVGHLRGCGRRKIFPIRETRKETYIKQIGNCMPTSTRDNPNQGRVYDVNGISPCLNKMDGGGREPLIAIPAIAQDKSGVMVREATKQGYALAVPGDSINLEQPNSKTRRGRVGKGVAQTLTTSCNQAVICGGPIPVLHQGLRIRKLTPRECFRLQGWTDEYFERAASVNTDSQLYKQAGNGVTVNVVYAIASRLN